MPIGIIVNVAAVAVGGIFGGFVGHRLSESFKTNMNMVFGACAMCMGISSITQMENMPAVILAVILGSGMGLAVHLGDRINRAGLFLQRRISGVVSVPQGLSEEAFGRQLMTAIVLFCASGTGIYGAMVSGMNGDQSILLAKSILDLPTALIFACSLGAVISLIALPQLVIYLFLFLTAGVVFPMTTPAMINDFKACGGIIIFVTGFRMINVKQFPTADMIPAMMIVMPVSWLWSRFVVPIL